MKRGLLEGVLDWVILTGLKVIWFELCVLQKCCNTMWIVLTHPRVMWFKRAELIITYGYKTFFFFFKSLKKKGKKKKKKKRGTTLVHTFFFRWRKGPTHDKGYPFQCVLSVKEGLSILSSLLSSTLKHFTSHPPSSFPRSLTFSVPFCQLRRNGRSNPLWRCTENDWEFGISDFPGDWITLGR